MSYIRIEYDDQPEDIMEKVERVSQEFHIAVIQEEMGDGYVTYSIHRINEDKDVAETTST